LEYKRFAASGVGGNHELLGECGLNSVIFFAQFGPQGIITFPISPNTRGTDALSKDQQLLKRQFSNIHLDLHSFDYNKIL